MLRNESAHPIRDGFLRYVTDQAQVGMAAVDMHTCFQLWNPFMEHLTGLPAAEVLGRPYAELDLCEEHDLDEMWRRALSGEQFESPDLRCTPANLQPERWAVASFNPLRDDDGHLVGALAIVHEISGRKRVEQALRTSEERLRAIIEQSPVSMAIVDFDGTIEYINRRAIDTFGYLPADIPTMDHWWVQAYPDPEYRAHVLETWTGLTARAMAERHEIEGREYRVTCKDGSTRVMYILGVPVQNKVFVMFEDVTEQHTAAEALASKQRQMQELNQSLEQRVEERTQALQRSLEQLTNLSRLVPGLLYQYQMFPDGRSCIPYASEAIREMFGLEPEEVRRDAGPLFEMVHPADYEGLVASIDASARKLAPWQHEFRVEVPGRGIRWCVGESRPQVRDDGSLLWHGFLSDITERRVAEDALRIAKDAAESATRAKTQFLANMSHEIRTPLNAVLGFTGLVLESELTTEQREYLTLVESGSRDLLLLMNDLLDLSKIEAERLQLQEEEFDPSGAIAQVIQMFAMAAKTKSLYLSMKASSNVPTTVVGDPRRLRQVLVNLIGNAVKFTPRGEIRVSVESSADLEHAANGVLHYRVEDTGIGIPADKLETIFRPFTQADDAHHRLYGGAGLGLTIARRLVEMMGGRMWVESSPNLGSCFHFTIQLKAATPRRSFTSPRGAEDATASCRRILVVEDDASSRRFLEALLSRQGHCVECAGSGPEALDMLATRDFDVVLMDVQIPTLNGFETTRRIRAGTRRPDIPIIAITALAMTGDQASCVEAGMNGYVSKPIDRSRLLALIDQLC